MTEQLDLSKFAGATLETITIGRHQISFDFDSQASLVSEGRWYLVGPDGSVVDQSMDLAHRDFYRVHVCVGKRVVAAVPEPPKAIALTFETGYVLRLVDDSEQYESFHIQPDDIHI